MNRQTIFSPDRVHRYTLWRVFNPAIVSYLMVIGLNPSTADEVLDDPTIRRCIRFAKDFGFGALCMTNAFAYRATDPRVMKAASDPVGPENDRYLVEIAKGAGQVIAAWGTHGEFMGRGREVAQLITPHRPVWCLGKTAGGYPKHPLYLKANTKPEVYA